MGFNTQSPRWVSHSCRASFIPLAILLLMFLSNMPSASHGFTLRRTNLPSVLVRASVVENTCQCNCCYSVGTMQRTECVPNQYTSFDVHTCPACTVAACAKAFPISCEQPTSVVNADCIVRRGWMLLLVPVLFITISVGLLVYGCCIKKYDGYHPVSDVGDAIGRARSRLSDYIPFNTGQHSRSPSWGGNGGTSPSVGGATPTPARRGVDGGPGSSRGGPSLPPISELQEVEPEADDQLVTRTSQYGSKPAKDVKQTGDASV